MKAVAGSLVALLLAAIVCAGDVTKDAESRNENNVVKNDVTFLYPNELPAGSATQALRMRASDFINKAKAVSALSKHDGEVLCLGAECAADVLNELFKAIADAVGNPWGKCTDAWIAWGIAQVPFEVCIATCPADVRAFFRSWMNYGIDIMNTMCGDGFKPSSTLAPTTRPPGMRCYKCKKKRTHWECNRTWETCKHNYQSCQTNIHQKKGKLEITKGCSKNCREHCHKNHCHHCCYSDLCNSFVSQTTPAVTTAPTVAPTPSEHPDCRESAASQCLTTLSRAILETEIGDGDFSSICSTLIPDTKKCIQDNTWRCSGGIQERFQRSMDILLDSVEGKCPICDVPRAESCVQELRRKREEGAAWTDICEYKDIALECKERNMRDCPDDEKSRIETLWGKALEEVGDLCAPKMEIIGDGPKLVAEGGQSSTFDYRVLKPPNEICPEQGCRVFVDVATELGTTPRCIGREVISQAVIATSHPRNNACSREVTNGNWRQLQTHEIFAKSDMKFDGLQTRNISVTLRAEKDGVTLNIIPIANIPVTAIDMDLSATCKSINDPHTTTFDGHYYNNFNEGYFILYKHKFLPYEVQVIFQRCNNKASCNCAVAVRSGDSVFVVDRCRRRGDTCTGRNCGGLLQTRHYIWDRVTPGTKIFRRNNGRTFEVVFPIGTMVKVQAQGQFLNVLVTASPSDLQLTEGLCGFYDGDRYNDLTLPSGRIYQGEGTQRGRQPRGFNLAWRVPQDKRIFSGTPRQPYPTQAHCQCRPSSSGGAPVSFCDYSALLELCDFNTGNEITGSLTPQPGAAAALWENGIPALQQQEMDDVDVEEEWSPPASEWPSEGWTEEAALEHCEKYIRLDSEIGQVCDSLPGLNMTDDIDSCVEDIKTTGSTDWALAALEAMKDQCETLVTRNSTLLEDEGGVDIVDDIADNICINECSGSGVCFMSECICDEGFTGADCSIDENAVPQKVILPINGLCDTRIRACANITVLGDSFTDNPDLSCSLEEVEVTYNDTIPSGNIIKVSAEFISFNQISCSPPQQYSYRIAVSNDGANFSDWRIFVPFDSACYICETPEPGAAVAKCTRKLGDNCIVNGKCYSSRQVNPDNVCQMCRPDISDSNWQRSDVDECRSRSGIIAAITVPVLVVMGGGIILTVFLHKRHVKRRWEAARKSLEIKQTDAPQKVVTPAVNFR